MNNRRKIQMSNFFISLFHLLDRHKWLLLLTFILFSGMIIYGGFRIRFVEEISGISGSHSGTGDLAEISGKTLLNEKLIIDIFCKDSMDVIPVDRLMAAADSLEKYLRKNCGIYISKLMVRTDDSMVSEMLETTGRYLPVFLEKDDYQKIEALTESEKIEEAVSKAYRQLLSPASLVTKKMILSDPLGIRALALVKMNRLNFSENYENLDGYVFSSDHRHLFMFLLPSNPPGETRQNGIFLTELKKYAALTTRHCPGTDIRYFGAAAVAAGNASRVKKDILISISIAVFLIFFFLGWYFRNLRVPLLGLLPAFFGGGLALAFLATIKGSVSSIALGIGSVILGLIIDYSLYLINHFRRKKEIVLVLKEMSQSIVVCALTTAGAFMCLVFLGSSVLHDLGWFSAISVAGAALFALVFLPHILPWGVHYSAPTALSRLIDHLASLKYERMPLIIGLLLAASVLSLVFARKAGFETDMNVLNHMDPELREAGEALQKTAGTGQKNIYYVSMGRNLQKALERNDIIQKKISPLVQKQMIVSNAGITILLVSDSLACERIHRWNEYWTPQKRQQVLNCLNNASAREGFSKGAFTGFDDLISRSYSPLPYSENLKWQNSLFSDWIRPEGNQILVSGMVTVKPSMRNKIIRQLGGTGGTIVFDRQYLTDRFIDSVRTDFNRLVIYTMIFVSLLLWLSFGRIELALLTSVPMYLSWLITLGVMGLTGLRFNIFNIIVSSFIFGLGVDYSILITRGLLHDYTYRSDELPGYKVSVILSSATTIFGVAALFTARHPALNSIALVSVTGILTVVLTAFTLQPMIYGWFLGKRLRDNRFPVTARVFVKTIITWGNIVLIAVLLAIAGNILYFLAPLTGKRKEIIFHRMFQALSNLYIFVTFSDQKLINPGKEDFTKPAVLICNHQSLIETPALVRLHHRIIILTTTWVHRSLVFGPIARLASFYNVDGGLDTIIEKLRLKVDEGYSILVFPEAHRSPDGRIQRFHKGAFYLAERLGLDIIPIMFFGSGDFLPKGAFWGRPNKFRQKIFPRVKPDDTSFGDTYQERNHGFRQFYIREYENLKAEEGDASYYRRKVNLAYVFKGPVLEWYIKTKFLLEKNYQLLNEFLPRKGKIYDLGCGYGYISCMLALTSGQRQVIAVDYDKDKIGIADNSFLRLPGLEFRNEDIMESDIRSADGILLNDVLHYLTSQDQERMLKRCLESLNPGGVLIIRDADRSVTALHKRSRLTEFISTRINFNKTYDSGKSLHFLTSGDIFRIAGEAGFDASIISSKKHSSNRYYHISKGFEPL